MATRSRGHGWWHVVVVVTCLGIAVARRRSNAIAPVPVSKPAEPTVAQALLVFVAIVIVSYEYLWFTTILRWVPTFRDTLVPLLLGVGEIVPAFLMERWTAWWLVMTIFIAFGGGAYLNTITRLHRALFSGDDHVRHRISGLLWKLVAQCGGGILIGVGTLWAVHVWPSAAAPLTAISASALAFGIAVGMVVISEGVLNEVFARHGIRRRPEWPRWENVGWTPNR